VTRRIWVDVEAADYARKALTFCGPRMLARVDSQTRRKGEVLIRETRYFACSLDPAYTTAWELMRLIRGHWQVENSLHHIKDRWWDEDRHYTKQDRLGEGMTVLRSAAVSILRAAPGFDADEPIRARADRLSRRIERAIDLLTQTFS
jgi:predicted transposase YbfD/YdcC